MGQGAPAYEQQASFRFFATQVPLRFKLQLAPLLQRLKSHVYGNSTSPPAPSPQPTKRHRNRRLRPRVILQRQFLPRPLSQVPTLPPHQPPIRNRIQSRLPHPTETVHHPLRPQPHRSQAPELLPRIVVHRGKIVFQATLEQKISIEAPDQDGAPGGGGDLGAGGGHGEDGAEG